MYTVRPINELLAGAPAVQQQTTMVTTVPVKDSGCGCYAGKGRWLTGTDMEKEMDKYIQRQRFVSMLHIVFMILACVVLFNIAFKRA